LLREVRIHRGRGVRTLTSSLHLPWSYHTTWRILKREGFYKKKLKRRPVLSPKHITDRLAFARKHLLDGTDWEKVVFSDEKKFRWDGPDGVHSFWFQQGDALPPVAFSKDYHAFRGVMVWGCVSANGLLRLERMRGSVTAQTYVTMLSGDAMAAIHASHGTDFTFQQDNATPHRATTTREWFEEETVPVMEWPALSPDLNPMENVWAMLVREVYEGGRYYESDDALWDGIQAGARRITADRVRPLIHSMKERLVNLLARGGKYAQ
jgi:hypothetical protein